MLVQPGFFEQSRLKIVFFVIASLHNINFWYISGALLVDALRLAFFGALLKNIILCDFGNFLNHTTSSTTDLVKDSHAKVNLASHLWLVSRTL